MPGFNSIRDLLITEESEPGRISTFRKIPVQVTGAGIWFDLSMSPGNPVPQYYAASPGVAISLTQSGDGGLFHMGAVSPKKKFLRKALIMTQTAACVPMPMILMDYLMFYPFIDQGTTDEQFLTNTVTLPRYTDGNGVQIMAIVVAGQTGGQQFQVNYTNSSGVSGRISPPVTMNTQALVGTLITTTQSTVGSAGPFLPLQAGDSGVRSIESVTCLGADVGLLTLVLVRPLAQLSVRGIDAPVELDYVKDCGLITPEIKDNAYLNFICCPNGSLSGAQINGYIETLWE